MVTVTVGATGDYGSVSALIVALTAIQPLADDYDILMQDGIYAEQIAWTVDTGGHTVTVRAITPGAAIIDGQATRDYCVVVTGGALEFKDMRFEDPVMDGVAIGGAAVGASRFRGCSFYRCLKGVEDYNNADALLVEGCYFEDMDVNAVATYSDGAASKIIRGCHAHWTATGPTADFAFEMDGGVFAVTGSGIFGCRVTTADVTKGPSGSYFGADYQIERCRSINPRGYHFRQGWGTTFRVVECLAKKTAGATYYGVYSTEGTTWTILRCLFLSENSSYVGVNVTGGSTVTIKNCGFVGLKVDNAVAVDATSTVDNSYNGYHDCGGKVAGAGTFNNPETGEVIADPLLSEDTFDACVPVEGSPWENVGDADGLPVVQDYPDIGCEMIMPAASQES